MKKKTTQQTSLEAIEAINLALRNSQLSPKALKDAGPAIETLANTLNISKEEAIIVSAIVELAADGRATNRDLASFFYCSNVQMYLYMPVFKSLSEKGYIRTFIRRKSLTSYQLTNEFLSAVMENRPFAKRNASNLDIHSFLTEFTILSDERHEENLEYCSFIYDVRTLINSNLHLPLCKYLKLILDNNSRNDEIITVYLLRACSVIGLLGGGSLTVTECSSLFDTTVDQNVLTRMLQSPKNFFVIEHILEPAITPENSLADVDRYTLTSEFRKKYLKGLHIEARQTMREVSRGTIRCDKIAEKQLYYNATEAAQIDELCRLLKPRNFKRIQKSLRDYGYRSGFACLFHGAPGTGKTETAMQLARLTGRNIIPVDLSQVRDKYVGESEKRTKAIFDDYRDQLKRSKVAPILLLNEADGLLSQRLSQISDSVDQMANTMQNIILQELENFEGILIATTNLTCNLDSAFDRRFLYKVEFHRPCVEARQSIWNTMIRDLKPSEAKTLAEQFEFSGGEIENIARKYVVNNILHNKKTDIETLRVICNTEKSARTSERKRIGF